MNDKSPIFYSLIEALIDFFELLSAFKEKIVLMICVFLKSRLNFSLSFKIDTKVLLMHACTRLQ
jgi:hypothetical protein